MERSH
ncbi:Protein of unknown function [Pyronema omphalodes CBS 100304]